MVDAGLGIDLDLADVAAVREVAGARAVGRGLVQAGLHAGRQLVELERGLRHLVDAEAAVGAGDGEAAVLELHVGFRRLQHVGGELLALGDDLFADQHDGAAAHSGRARAAGAHAERDRVGVALDELDPVGIDAEPVDQHLRLDRVVALAVRDRAGDERHAAERIEADFRGLDGRVGGLLDGVGDADAAQHAAPRRLLAPRLESPSSRRASWRGPCSPRSGRCRR